MTQKEKVLKILSNGNILTTSQAAKRGITNLNKVISDLRSEGYPVYFNSRSNRSENHYRIGTPNRSMVASAYDRDGASAFTSNK